MQRTLKAMFLQGINKKSQLLELIPHVYKVRSSRSSVLPCTGNNLLYFETVQGQQELGEL